MPNSGKDSSKLPGFGKTGVLGAAGAYVSNAAKEAKDLAGAWKRSNALAGSQTGLPDGVAKQAIAAAQAKASKNQDAQFGQLAGAILQGRRYDSSGKQIKK